MSETKKQLGRKSRRIGEENYQKAFFSIFHEPATFSELLSKTGFSRATLTSHLKGLEEDGLIERRFKDGKRVYQTKPLDEETIVAELKISYFDFFSQLLSRFIPDAKERIDMFLKSLAKEIIQFRKDVVEHGQEKALKLAKKRLEQRSKPQEPLKTLKIIEAPKQGEDE